MKFLNPVGEIRVADDELKLTPRLDSLTGKSVGIVDDGAGKAYFKRIEELLLDSVKPSRIIHRIKKTKSEPSSPEFLDKMAKDCDAVIVGVAM